MSAVVLAPCSDILVAGPELLAGVADDILRRRESICPVAFRQIDTGEQCLCSIEVDVPDILLGRGRHQCTGADGFLEVLDDLCITFGNGVAAGFFIAVKHLGHQWHAQRCAVVLGIGLAVDAGEVEGGHGTQHQSLGTVLCDGCRRLCLVGQLAAVGRLDDAVRTADDHVRRLPDGRRLAEAACRGVLHLVVEPGAVAAEVLVILQILAVHLAVKEHLRTIVVGEIR